MRSLSWIWIRSDSSGLIAQSSDEHRQMRRHLSRLQVQENAKPFADFLAERRAMDASDLAVTFGCGISHEASSLLAGSTGEVARCSALDGDKARLQDFSP